MAEILAWSMVAAALAAMLAGVPIALALGGAAALAGGAALAAGAGTIASASLGEAIWVAVIGEPTLAALPLFVFAGAALAESGLAERARLALAGAAATLPGAGGVLALIHGASFGTAAGSTGGTVALMAALGRRTLEDGGAPARRFGGAIIAGATLGALLPPSLLLVSIAHGFGLPVAGLFFAAIFPALLLLAGFVGLAVMLGRRAPAAEADAAGTARARWAVLLPFGLALAALPAAALAFGLDAVALAALAAAASLVVVFVTGPVAAERRARARRAMVRTARFAGALFALVVAAFVFAAVFAQLDGPAALQRAVNDLAIEPWVALLAALAILILLGAAFDVREIAIFAVPLLAQIFAGLDFGEHVARTDAALWAAVLFALALQTGPLTPPFGMALLVVKAAAPGARLAEIARGCLPYAAIQLGGIAVVLALPGLALWLPRALAV
jgi:TRAP-type mannitol/chloroaromatic compound transport system permease large subunit